jgi:hypothetical protein
MIKFYSAFVDRDKRLITVMHLSAERAVGYLTDTVLGSGTVLAETDTHEVIPVAMVREDGTITVLAPRGIYTIPVFAYGTDDVRNVLDLANRQAATGDYSKSLESAL